MSTALENVDTPAQVAPKAVVALLHVADVQRSIEFYEKLGFEVGNEPLKNDQDIATFVWMHHGTAAQVMLTRSARQSTGPQDVLFYLYVTDMLAYRETLIASGISVGKLEYPFWSPDGEFRVDDPDGWIWMVC